MGKESKSEISASPELNIKDIPNLITMKIVRRIILFIVLASILVGAFFLKCEKPKYNIRVPYNPLYKNTEVKDWSEDSTMTQGKIEVLNEIMAR